jgi:hypothetical protein
MTIMVFWDVTQFNLVDCTNVLKEPVAFRVIYPEDGGSRFL